MNKNAAIALGVLGAVIVGYFGVFFYVKSWSENPRQTESLNEFALVEVSKGKSPEQLCKSLASNDLIDEGFQCSFFFSRIVDLDEIKPGFHNIQKGQSPQAIFTRLTREETAMAQPERGDQGQTWYVDLRGTANTSEILSATRKKLGLSLFNKKFAMHRENGQIISSESKDVSPKVTIAFKKENQTERTQRFKNALGRVVLFRISLREDGEMVNANFAAYEPPKHCLGELVKEKAEDCNDWQRFAKPIDFKVKNNVAVASDQVVNYIRDLPFKEL